MTNKIIDADALLRWVKATKGLFDDDSLDDFYLSTIDKINELSSRVPKEYVDVNVLKTAIKAKNTEMLGQVDLSNYQYIGIKQAFKEVLNVINEFGDD